MIKLHQFKKLIWYSTLSTTIVVIFFVGIEIFLRLIEYQPYIKLHNVHLPYWISRVDSIYLNDYRKRLKILGKVNQDFYAYRPDPTFGYKLKSNFKRVVSGYSSAFPVDNIPQWTIVSDENGFRVKEGYSKTNNSLKNIYFVGD